jgi:alkylhydroperoxidase family enzyme
VKPRLQPLIDATPEAAEVLAKAAEHDGRPHNAALTMAYNPKLLKRFAVFAGYFLTHAQMARRDVELVTLRTAYRTGSEYYFGHHVLLGRATGLTDGEIRAVGEHGALHGRDALLMRVVDEIVTTGDLADATWNELAELYNDELLMEIVLLVGFYQMVAGYANSLRLEREPGVPGWEFLDASIDDGSAL